MLRTLEYSCFLKVLLSFKKLSNIFETFTKYVKVFHKYMVKISNFLQHYFPNYD